MPKQLALIFVIKVNLGFEFSPGNSIIFFNQHSRTVWKILTNEIEFYFNDNFKIQIGFGQKILETEMKNVQASQDCFGKISIDRIKNCGCSAWKMSNFRNEDRSYQVENAGYAEFERVSKTQQFFDIFLASSWAWALFENVSYKMFCKNVNIRVQTSQLYAIQGLNYVAQVPHRLTEKKFCSENCCEVFSQWIWFIVSTIESIRLSGMIVKHIWPSNPFIRALIKYLSKIVWILIDA